MHNYFTLPPNNHLLMFKFLLCDLISSGQIHKRSHSGTLRLFFYQKAMWSICLHNLRIGSSRALGDRTSRHQLAQQIFYLLTHSHTHSHPFSFSFSFLYIYIFIYTCIFICISSIFNPINPRVLIFLLIFLSKQYFFYISPPILSFLILVHCIVTCDSFRILN